MPQFHEPEIEHTPMVYLYSEERTRNGVTYKRLVGKQCLHCNLMFTVASNPSQPEKARGAFTFPNRRHNRRVLAAAAGLTKFRDMLKGVVKL